MAGHLITPTLFLICEMQLLGHPPTSEDQRPLGKADCLGPGLEGALEACSITGDEVSIQREQTELGVVTGPCPRSGTAASRGLFLDMASQGSESQGLGITRLGRAALPVPKAGLL